MTPHLAALSIAVLRDTPPAVFVAGFLVGLLMFWRGLHLRGKGE